VLGGNRRCQGLLPRGRYPNGVRCKCAQVNALLRDAPAVWPPGTSLLTLGDEGDDNKDKDGGALVAPDGTISHRMMWDYLHLTAATYARLGVRLLPALARMAAP
jgi:lysophospholipase L1-like esterase